MIRGVLNTSICHNHVIYDFYKSNLNLFITERIRNAIGRSLFLKKNTIILENPYTFLKKNKYSENYI